MTHGRERHIDRKEYAHDRLGESFAGLLSDYDTQRRIDVLVDTFLPDDALSGTRVLDVGCGLGFFSARLVERGADVTACDLGPSMVAATRERVGCRAVVADAVRLVDYFEPGSFDVVVSSECIEHTPDPSEALRQMAAMLRPGGLLSVSTPNIIWLPAVKLGNWLRVRPFDGYENFSSWARIRSILRSAGVRIVREAGLHLIPFQLGTRRLCRRLDDLQWARAVMINICVLGRRA